MSTDGQSTNDDEDILFLADLYVQEYGMTFEDAYAAAVKFWRKAVFATGSTRKQSHTDPL